MRGGSRRHLAVAAVGALVLSLVPLGAVLLRGSRDGAALPDFVRQAPAATRLAYAFAAAHPEVLQYIACYCGCGALGHTSNLDCFISARGPGRRITWDRHAYG